MSAVKRIRDCLVAGAIALIGALPVQAQDRVIDDISVTTRGDQAVITIEFACEMRFVADTPTEGGALLEVRVAPFDACRQRGIGSTIASESYLPVGAAAAHLVEVEFSSLGLGDSIVMLTFDRPVSYRITQRRTLREVEITVDVGDDADDSAAARRPISVRVVEPETTADYMINLQSTRNPVDDELADSIAPGENRRLYVSQIRVDGVLWHRLRLGFFASEAEAEAALAGLRERFPRAWIGRAEPAEIALAEASALRSGQGGITTLTADALEAAPGEPPAEILALDPDEIASMMTEARSKLLAADNAAAVELYRRLAQTPGEHRAEAIEFLGLAYERNGQNARARAEYERYLREFPDSQGRPRVEQRLSAMTAQASESRTALREADASAGADWDWSAGLSQYYRRYDNQFAADQPELTTQSALLTDADFSLSRTGERFDMSARLSINNYHDLLDPAERGRGDQNRTSYAYFDLAEAGQKWDLRLGRQSLHTFGVLGRFDGAHFSYGFGADKRLHFTQGFPVESTRDSIETDRQFTGVAVEFIDLVGSWDISAFVNSQTIEGIDARRGVGTEARYFDDRRTVTAMLDYDVDYSELNMLLVLGTWRLPNRMTVSALVDRRLSPILTTRNALIGQPVETIDEMLLVWTEDEVRALARDRTAQSRTMTIGLATPLGERLQLNFDMTRSEIDGTVESGGVAAVPGTGPQNWYSTSLVATGLFGTRDVNIWNVRVGEADNYKTSLLTWDARFPIGRKLRINPRIRLVYWEGLTDGRERETVAPALRFLLNLRNRYRLELEIGRDETTRRDSLTERDANSTYFNLGYRASF